MTIKFKAIRPLEPELIFKTQDASSINVTKELRKEIKKISEKTMLPMYEVSCRLIKYALEHIEWE